MFSPPDLQASCCRLEENRTSMEDAAQSSLQDRPGSTEPCPTLNTAGTTNPGSDMKEGKGNSEEEGQNSQNSKVDDKKKAGHQSAKYKSVSYRKIRRGNTRQRIDEFESMMNL